MIDTIVARKVNDVYMHISGDQGVIQEINEHFSFFVPNYKFMPAFREGRWDGKIRLMNLRSQLLYIGLQGRLERLCRERGYELALEGFRGDFNISLKEAKDFITKLNTKFIARDYQIDAFTNALRARRQLILSPTASGKSFIIFLLLNFLKKKTLVIVPNVQLIHQLANDFDEYDLDRKFGSNVHKIFSGQEKDSDALVQISTWQSAHRQPKKWFDQFEVVVGDECHLFQANSLVKIMHKLTNCPWRFGFTGTLDGTLAGEMVLEGHFGAVRKVTTTAKLIEENHIANLKIKNIILEYPIEYKTNLQGEGYRAEIEALISNEARNKFITNLAYSLQGNVIIFVNYVEKHGDLIWEMLQKNKESRSGVYYIHGGVEGERRDYIRRIVNEQKTAIILATAGTTSTGTNIPNVDYMIFASPNKSRIRVLQSIGRGLRKSETKHLFTLFDISDDLTVGRYYNTTFLHFLERLKYYRQESFQYKKYRVELNQ